MDTPHGVAYCSRSVELMSINLFSRAVGAVSRIGGGGVNMSMLLLLSSMTMVTKVPQLRSFVFTRCPTVREHRTALPVPSLLLTGSRSLRPTTRAEEGVETSLSVRRVSGIV